MRSKGKLNIIAGLMLFFVMLTLILLSVFKPEAIGKTLQLLELGKTVRLTETANRFYSSMENVTHGLVLPEGQDPTIMTAVKALAVDLAGIIANIFLGSVFAEKLDVSEKLGYRYAYFPCTAAVFLINGAGRSHWYLLGSIFMLLVFGFFVGD